MRHSTPTLPAVHPASLAGPSAQSLAASVAAPAVRPRRRVRILVLNWLDGENPRAGGAELHLHRVFGGLAARGHHVTVIASGWPGAAPLARRDGMRIIRVGSRLTFALLAPIAYARLRRRRRYDLVVEDLNKAPLLSPAWVKEPVVLLVHHLFGPVAFGTAALPVAVAVWSLEKLIGRAYAGVKVVAVSPSTAAELRAVGVHPDRLEVIANGVDRSPVVRGAPCIARATTPTVLHVGRLERYKRVDLLVRAIAGLRAEGTPVRLLVAGSGSEDAALRRLARRLGISGDVAFLGRVTEREKQDLFASAWVHVTASSKEGWGIAVIEAASRGTPTVASDSPGLRDAVIDGRTGLLVRDADPSGLAAAIRHLLEHPDLREAMGRAAKSYAAGFTWRAAVDGTERALLAALPE